MNPTTDELADWLEAVGAAAERRGGPLTARCTVELSQEFWGIAQGLANDPRLPYNGDVGGVFRFGLTIAIMYWLDRVKRPTPQAATANLAE